MGMLPLDSDVLIEPPAREDRKRLQGTWNYVSGRFEAQLFIAGSYFTVKFANGDIYLGTFTLDPTKAPAAMDLHVQEGPEPHRGKTSLAIYELEGNRLLWCPGEPGSGERPRSFPCGEESRRLCLTLQRETSRHTKHATTG